MHKIFLSSIIILSLSNLFSQDTSLGFPGNNKEQMPTANKLDFSTTKPGKMIVHKDERLDKIGEFVRSGEETLEGVLIDGYRVIIFFDMNKSLAEQQKAMFITMYPEHKAYVDYLAPNYRVRVGNFRTELEAEKLKQEILASFPTSIVVPDKIQLPQLNQTTAQ